MSVEPISESSLRAALSPYRVAPLAFEEGVRRRLAIVERDRAERPRAARASILNAVAALLPLQFFTGCQVTGPATNLAPASIVYKLLGLLAFPAISLFMLLGAAVYSLLKIRSLRSEPGSPQPAGQAIHEELLQWWRIHWRGALAVFIATLVLSANGATWLLFLFYVGSFGLLLFVLSSLAKSGLGNRLVVSQFCAFSLLILGQAAGFEGIGGNEIHFIDQMIMVPLFFVGGFILLVIPFRDLIARSAASPVQLLSQVARGSVLLAGVIALAVWFMSPILWPYTPARLKQHVEAFHNAPDSFISWRCWETVASWVIEEKMNPDLSGAERLLAQEIQKETNPLTLGSAFRIGLVRRDQIDSIRDPIGDYQQKLRSMIAGIDLRMKPQRLTSLEFDDWVIRAAVLRQDLTPARRDFLAARLHANLENMATNQYLRLEEPLRVTQLLEVIERPLDRNEYRETMHDLLRRFHCQQGGGFQYAGGFKEYLNVRVASSEATSYAVQLMELYGIPEGLDLNWVRSYLRPKLIRDPSETWTAVVTLNRLNRLPGVTQPTWLQVFYHERNLLAALILIGLCFYATLTAPAWDVRSTVPEVCSMPHGTE